MVEYSIGGKRKERMGKIAGRKEARRKEKGDKESRKAREEENKQGSLV